MNALFLHIYAAPDESRETARAALVDCLQQQGIAPTVRSLPPDDQVAVVAEIDKNLFDAMCQGLEAWGRQRRGRDASTRASHLLTRPRDATFTLALLLERSSKAADATA
jgi:hypothetical protein